MKYGKYLFNLGLLAVAAADFLLIVPRAPAYQYALSVLATAALLFRHRCPWMTLLLTLPGAFVTEAILASLIALYNVALAERRRAYLGVTGIVVTCALLSPWTGFGTMPIPKMIRAVMYAALIVATPIGLGLLVQTRRELANRLREIARHRERERELHAKQVRFTERTRLAREMHDVVSHHVSLIALTAGALSVRATDDVTLEAAETLRGLAVKTLDELRHMVGVLRSVPLGLLPQPRLADLNQLLENHRNASMRTTGLDELELPEPMERAVFRTIQEALTNISKHAPHAPTNIEVVADDNLLIVQVTNEPAHSLTAVNVFPSGGHGLTGLRERAQLLGGQCEAHARADGGFTVRVKLPLEKS